MRAPQSQSDIVAQDELIGQNGQEISEEIKLPGLKTLHTRPREEIAEVLVNVLKSRPNITGLNWKPGESLTVTYITHQ